jgi:hypothetical protein
MTNAMRIRRDQIALEASLTTNTQDLLRKIFPTIVSEFTGFVGRFVPSTPAVALAPNQNKFLAEVQKHSYMDIEALRAFVPEGLNVSYPKYEEALLPAVQHAAVVVDQVLSPYSTFLSQLINNDDNKFSTKSFDKVYKDLAAKRAEYNKQLGKCFKNSSHAVETTVGKVVTRNADWRPVFHSCNEMTKLINTVDRKALNKKVEECTHLLNTIISKLKKGDFENISPQNVENLANGAFQVASELEFFSVIYYKVLSYTTAINKTVEHCEAVFNNYKAEEARNVKNHKSPKLATAAK